MPDDDLNDPPVCDGWLADYRATVERLREETIAEIGPQPVAPEMASMIAVMLVSVPLGAMLLPSSPVAPEVWEIALGQAAVWGAAFVVQRQRYERFHDRLRRKIAAHGAREGGATGPADPAAPLQPRASGQTIGDWAAA